MASGTGVSALWSEYSTFLPEYFTFFLFQAIHQIVQAASVPLRDAATLLYGCGPPLNVDDGTLDGDAMALQELSQARNIARSLTAVTKRVLEMLVRICGACVCLRGRG